MKLGMLLSAVVGLSAGTVAHGALLSASDAFRNQFNGWSTSSAVTFGYANALPGSTGYSETLYSVQQTVGSGLQVLTNASGTDPIPGVFLNPSFSSSASMGTATLQPGQIALYPGQSGEYSFVKFSPGEAGIYRLNAAFTAGADSTGATTDLHAFVGGSEVASGTLTGYSNSQATTADLTGEYALSATDSIYVLVGYGNGAYGNDTTAAVSGITLVKLDDGGGEVGGQAAVVPEAGASAGMLGLGMFLLPRRRR